MDSNAQRVQTAPDLAGSFSAAGVVEPAYDVELGVQDRTPPGALENPAECEGDAAVVLRAVDVSMHYRSRPVLQDINLQIAAGEMVVLTGDNGAGKTTLLRCLAWYTRPSYGEVFWLGRPASRHGGNRHLVALAAHETALYPHLTARENLVFAARMYGIARAADCADRWLASTSLAPFADRLAATLSRGMRQRLGLARALIHEPLVMLLDEPYAGLDARGTAWLMDLLRGYCDEGRAVCFSTHDISTADALADCILRLDGGRLEVIKIQEGLPRRAA